MGYHHLGAYPHRCTTNIQKSALLPPGSQRESRGAEMSRGLAWPGAGGFLRDIGWNVWKQRTDAHWKDGGISHEQWFIHG